MMNLSLDYGVIMKNNYFSSELRWLLFLTMSLIEKLVQMNYLRRTEKCSIVLTCLELITICIVVHASRWKLSRYGLTPKYFFKVGSRQSNRFVFIMTFSSWVLEFKQSYFSKEIYFLFCKKRIQDFSCFYIILMYMNTSPFYFFFVINSFISNQDLFMFFLSNFFPKKK